MTVGDERLLRALYDLKYLFGDKWVPAILVLLSNGPMRRKEILSTLGSYPIGKEWSDKHTVLHDSYLARTLKKMTEEGLLTRTHGTEAFPPRVYYSLKPEVVEFLELSKTMLTWIDAHPDLIAQAQAYARRNGDELETPTDEEFGPSDEDED
jgi:DNA-binding HxlR family transcriptional regulator